MITIEIKFPNLKKLDSFIDDFGIDDPYVAKAYSILTLTSRKVIAKLESYLSQFNITGTQLSIMIVLYLNENIPQTPTNLSKKFGLSTTTISNVLNTLHKNGFIKKENHEKDKRSHRISLSDNGIEFLNKFLPNYYSKYEPLFSNFQKEEIENLKTLLLKIFFNLDSF